MWLGTLSGAAEPTPPFPPTSLEYRRYDGL